MLRLKTRPKECAIVLHAFTGPATGQQHVSVFTVCDPSLLAQVCGTKMDRLPTSIPMISARIVVYDRLNEKARILPYNV